MSDHTPEPEDDEFAKMEAVMRASEQHREGGVDPELEDPDAGAPAEN